MRGHPWRHDCGSDVVFELERLVACDRPCSENFSHIIRKSQCYWKTIREDARVVVQFCQRKDVSEHGPDVCVSTSDVHSERSRDLKSNLRAQSRHMTSRHKERGLLMQH